MQHAILSRWKRWMTGIMQRHMPFMITCRQFEEFIIDYLEGDLPERQKTVFEFHLRICPECRDYLAAYRRTMEVSTLVVKANSSRVPDRVPDDLIKAIREARKA